MERSNKNFQPGLKPLSGPGFTFIPFGRFHRIGGAPPDTFRNGKYDAPEEVGGDRKCFNSPMRKLGLIKILHVNSNSVLTL